MPPTTGSSAARRPQPGPTPKASSGLAPAAVPVVPGRWVSPGPAYWRPSPAPRRPLAAHNCAQVKCDERPGGCLNCARLNLACPSGPDSLQPGAPAAVDDDDDAAQTQAGLRRLRTYRSCKACRGSKTRCSGQRPVCQRCRHKKIDCVYDGKQTPAWVDSVADTGARSGQSPPAADAGLQELTPASTPAERPPSTLNTPGAPEDDAGRGRADPGPGPGPLGW